MKHLTLTKYLSSFLKFFIPYVLIDVLCLILWIAGALPTGTLIWVGVVINGICLLLPAAYYFGMYLVFKKKCESYIPTEGVVSNWEQGFFRSSGAVIVTVDGKEYSSSAYFESDEAKEMVGRTIAYAIIDEMLFIYEIKD